MSKTGMAVVHMAIIRMAMVHDVVSDAIVKQVDTQFRKRSITVGSHHIPPVPAIRAGD